MAGEFLWVVLLTAMASGLALGLAFGFVSTAHARVQAGWRPRTGKRLVRLFYGCEEPRDATEGAWVLAGAGGLAAVFVLMCFLPFIAATTLLPDARSFGPAIAFAFALTGLLGHSQGGRLWRRYARVT